MPDAPSSPACADECPVRRTALIIEGKWTTQIVRDLLGGTRRYSELLHGLPGISPKVLAEHGLLERQVFPEVPPRTEYTLTPRGRALEGVIRAMAAFGEQLPPRA